MYSIYKEWEYIVIYSIHPIPDARETLRRDGVGGTILFQEDLGPESICRPRMAFPDP
jgi:hypothetical protein